MTDVLDTAYEYWKEPIEVAGDWWADKIRAAVDPLKPYRRDIVELDKPSTIELAIKDAYHNRRDLPAYQNELAAINWLGSSYSGADIKVVAHLYTDIDRNVRAAALSQEMLVSDEVAEACRRLVSLTPLSADDVRRATATDLRDYFLATAGLGFTNSGTGAEIEAGAIPPPENGIVKDKARSYILPLFYSYGLSQSGVEKIKHATARIEQEHTAIADSIQNQLKKLQELKDNASSTVTLATLQTLSVQSHREKMGVRALGQSYVKGYTRGPRTIGGSMIFTVFNEHALTHLIKAIGDARKTGEMREDVDFSSLIPDQLPPMDLTIIFANEYGSLSRMGIYGVEFMNDGLTMSVEDLLTEQVVNFVARDVDIMTSLGNRRLSQIERGVWSEGKERTASELLIGGGKAYNNYLRQLGVRRAMRRF